MVWYRQKPTHLLQSITYVSRKGYITKWYNTPLRSGYHRKVKCIGAKRNWFSYLHSMDEAYLPHRMRRVATNITCCRESKPPITSHAMCWKKHTKCKYQWEKNLCLNVQTAT